MPIRLSDIEEKKGTRLSDIPGEPTKRGVRLSDIPIEPTKKPMRLSDVEQPPRRDIAFEEMSKLGKIVDVVGRASYGAKSLIEEFRKQTPKVIHEHDPNKWMWEELKSWKPIGYKEAQKEFSPKELGEAFWRGFSGQERLRMEDMMKRSGVKFPGGAFMLEVATDPLMYGGYSLITRTISKGVGVAGKVLKMVPGVAKGAEKVKGFAQPAIAQLSKMFITKAKAIKDPETVARISGHVQKHFRPREANLFVRNFDAVQNLWKRWTLAIFPKYHMRNMVGNVWNIHLEGSTNIGHFHKMQALQLYRKYKNAPKMAKVAIAELRKMGISPKYADDLIGQMEKTGVVGKGWYAADIEPGLRRELEKGWLRQPLRIKAKKLVTGEIFTEKGLAFGSTIENNARGALWLARLDKGDDAVTAARTMKKYLFDYSDLTTFERKVMKRVFPFYTWTRKNLPLQVEMLWKKPEKFAALSPLLRGRGAKDLLRLKYANPRLYGRLPIEFRRDIDTVSYVPLEGLLPAGDLAKLVNPQEIFVELLSPYLKAPIELLIEKSFYLESEIERYDKETQELLKQDIPVKLKYLLTTVLPQARMLNEINQMIKKKDEKVELTTAEKLFSFTLQKVYKMSLKELRRNALLTLRGKAIELQQGARWAVKNKRPKELERIKETLRGVIKQIKAVR